MQRSALCRSRRELSNAYFLPKFGFDTAENDPCQVCPTARAMASPAHASPDPQAGPHYSASLPQARGHLAAAVTRDAVSKNRTFLSIFVKIFIDFGGFVLGCIEANFCDQILIGMKDPFWKALDEIYLVLL